jgi:spore germination protein GerM
VTRRRAVAAVLSAFFALALSACGIATSGGPRAIAPNQIPDVLQGAATTTTTPGCVVPVSVVLLDQLNNGAPVAVARCVSQQGQLSSVVRQLLLGPTDTELLKGFSSAIPPTTRLLFLNVSKLGVVTVDLSIDFISGSSPQQEQEVEQVVFTIACALTPVTRVAFEVEGSPQSVPIASGATVSGPVTAADDYNFGSFSCTP